jgi:PIN domain nuclease of toxin-antitoxin system
MKLLIDTHIFIWWTFEPSKINDKLLNILLDSNNSLYLSIISILEMQLKIQINKLKINENLESLIDKQIKINDLNVLSLKPKHIFELSNLPMFHKDPFDRLLIAQSRIEDLTLLSSDNIFSNYDVKRIS